MILKNWKKFLKNVVLSRYYLSNDQVGSHFANVGLDQADERVVAQLILDEEAWYAESGIAVDAEQDWLERRRMNERESARLQLGVGQRLRELGRDGLGRDQVEELNVALNVLHHHQVDQVDVELRDLGQT